MRSGAKGSADGGGAPEACRENSLHAITLETMGCEHHFFLIEAMVEENVATGGKKMVDCTVVVE